VHADDCTFSAQAFTTRSDIGPARGAAEPAQRGEAPVQRRNVVSFGAAPTGYVAGRGRGVSGYGGPSDSAPLPGQALLQTGVMCVCVCVCV
jgi:hypothetical protein